MLLLMPRSAHDQQFTRNDAAILQAARTVLLRDPDAPVSAVAAEAGVGMSALYRRYVGRDDLVRTLCRDGLDRFLEVAKEAAALPDPWSALESLVRGLVLADVHSLTVRLAGTFETTTELRALAVRAGDAGRAIVERARRAGALRPGLAWTDLTMLLEQLAAIRLDDARRTEQLRQRYLFLHLVAWRADPGPVTTVPGRAPSAAEASERWR
jgi:AcrR family transcriptional regulator